MIGSAGRTAARPQKQSSQVSRFRAPIQGMDFHQSLGDYNNPLHSLYSYNLVPYELGLQVRQGYREWQKDVTDGSGAGVHTLIPFDSVSEGNADDRLFAVNNEGIWNVTEFDTAPIQMVVFADQDPAAGYGTFTHYVNQAEDDVLFYADNVNGLYAYDAATDLWTNTGILTGLAEADVKFVMSYKNNVWFAKKDSTVGYYLPILSASGQVTEQFFGDKFKHGGALEGLFSWTVDGGDGVDDILVAVSHAGDVIMYTGDGPEADNWGMKGIWYIGEIPNTPRVGSEQGGELYLLSAYGVTSMNDLLSGVDSNVFTATSETSSSSMASKISGLLRLQMKEKISLQGWSIAMIPAEGGMLISTPTIGSDAPLQFYYNVAARGWGLWRGVPMQCFSEFRDSVFFGTVESQVMRMDVTVDNILIDPVDPVLNGEDIEFSILTSYSALDSAGVYKRVKLIRPDFLSSFPPAHSSVARFDFDLSESFDTSLRVTSNLNIGQWDIGEWDAAVWGSRLGVTFPSIGGAWGTGRYVAIATKGQTRTRTRLIGWDVIFDVGGPML